MRGLVEDPQELFGSGEALQVFELGFAHAVEPGGLDIGEEDA